MTNRDCPKCASSMERGFVVDEGDYGSKSVSTWQGGEPRSSFWTGLKMNKEEQFKIQTWRCKRCGFLESYASAG